MGALLAAGFRPWPAATPGSQPGSRAGPVSAGTAGFSLDDLPPASLPAPAEAAGYRIAMGDVVPGGGPELVVGVTLLSGDGLVAVFGRRAGGWEPLARREASRPLTCWRCGPSPGPAPTSCWSMMSTTS